MENCELLLEQGKTLHLVVPLVKGKGDLHPQKLGDVTGSETTPQEVIAAERIETGRILLAETGEEA